MANAGALYKRMMNDIKETPMLGANLEAYLIHPEKFTYGLSCNEHTIIYAACIIAEAILNCGKMEE